VSAPQLLRIATAAARLLSLTATATDQCSAVPHTATQQHSNTATHRHSNTATHAHYHTLPARTQQQCDTVTATCTITGHASHQCTTWTASDRRRRNRQHTRNTAPPSPCNAAVTHVLSSTARRTYTSSLPQTQSHAALRHHTAATARHDAATHTQKHKAAVAILCYCTARHSLRSRQRRRRTPKTHIVYRAYDAATMLHIIAGPMRTSRTCRLAPRSRHHHTTNTRTQKDKTRQAPPSTTRRQRDGACQPTQRTPTSHAHHIAHSHAAYRHTRLSQPPHARTTSHTAPTTAHCAIITACTPPHARHTEHGTQLRPPHTPPTANHTQSHTRTPRHTHVRAVRLPSVDGMLPDSWLLDKDNDLQDTRTAIASHHGTRRRRRPQRVALVKSCASPPRLRGYCR
jgi:hypothetical protein